MIYTNNDNDNYNDYNNDNNNDDNNNDNDNDNKHNDNDNNGHGNKQEGSRGRPCGSELAAIQRSPDTVRFAELKIHQRGCSGNRV